MNGILSLAALILVGSWIFSELRMWWRSRTFKTTGDFGLTTNEITDLNKAHRKTTNALTEFTKLQRKITTLERKGKNLRRNKKGEFDQRSKLGKKLNKDLKRIHVMAFRHNNEGEEANRDAEAIIEIPRSRALPWIKSEATRITNRLVLIGFTVTLFTMPLNGWDPSENWFYIISSWGILFYVIMRIFRRRLSTRLEPVFLN